MLTSRLRNKINAIFYFYRLLSFSPAFLPSGIVSQHRCFSHHIVGGDWGGGGPQVTIKTRRILNSQDWNSQDRDSFRSEAPTIHIIRVETHRLDVLGLKLSQEWNYQNKNCQDWNSQDWNSQDWDSIRSETLRIKTLWVENLRIATLRIETLSGVKLSEVKLSGLALSVLKLSGLKLCQEWNSQNWHSQD